MCVSSALKRQSSSMAPESRSLYSIPRWYATFRSAISISDQYALVRTGPSLSRLSTCARVGERDYCWTLRCLSVYARTQSMSFCAAPWPRDCTCARSRTLYSRSWVSGHWGPKGTCRDHYFVYQPTYTPYPLNKTWPSRQYLTARAMFAFWLPPKNRRNSATGHGGNFWHGLPFWAITHWTILNFCALIRTFWALRPVARRGEGKGLVGNGAAWVILSIQSFGTDGRGVCVIELVGMCIGRLHRLLNWAHDRRGWQRRRQGCFSWCSEPKQSFSELLNLKGDVYVRIFPFA